MCWFHGNLWGQCWFQADSCAAHYASTRTPLCLSFRVHIMGWFRPNARVPFDPAIKIAMRWIRDANLRIPSYAGHHYKFLIAFTIIPTFCIHPVLLITKLDQYQHGLKTSSKNSSRAFSIATHYCNAIIITIEVKLLAHGCKKKQNFPKEEKNCRLTFVLVSLW